jgi:chromosome segregation ATPase
MGPKRKTPDTSSSSIKNDKARSLLKDLSVAIEEMESQRDTAKTKVEELESSMARMESDTERVAALEGDVEYWRSDRERQKTAKDTFEMDLRKAKDEIQRLNALGASTSRDIEKYSKILTNREAQLEKLIQEKTRLERDVKTSFSALEQQKGQIAEMQLFIHEQKVAKTKADDTISALKAEKDKLVMDGQTTQSELASVQEECEDFKVQIRESEKRSYEYEKQLRECDVETDNLKLECERLKAKARTNEVIAEQLPMLLTDAYLFNPTGTGYLLGSGRILSLGSIGKAW